MREESFVDPYSIMDIYVDGIASVEPLSGGIFRVTYFTYARAPGSATVERLIVAKIVRPMSALLSPQGTMAKMISGQERQGAGVILDS